MISDFTIGDLWTNVVLTDDKSKCVMALDRLYHGDITDIAVIPGKPNQSSIHWGLNQKPNILVRISGMTNPVSLRTLGDGAKRFFAVALMLASSKNGFLLIDEAENGLHYSAQKNFWLMVLRAALDNNVQVVATIHGRDAVVAFAQAAIEYDGIGASLVRLRREEDGFIGTIRYSIDDLVVAAEYDIEAR